MKDMGEDFWVRDVEAVGGLSASAKKKIAQRSLSEQVVIDNTINLVSYMSGGCKSSQQAEWAFLRLLKCGAIDLGLKLHGQMFRYQWMVNDESPERFGMVSIGERVEASALECILGFATNGKEALEYIVNEMLTPKNRTLRKFWFEYGLTKLVKNEIKDSAFYKFYDENTVLPEKGSERRINTQPSNMAWEILCNSDTIDPAQTDGSIYTHMERAAIATIKCQQKHGFGGMPLNFLKKLFNRHPHFYAPDAASQFGEFVGMAGVWDCFSQGVDHSPHALEGYDIFYPQTLEDVQPVHLEMWISMNMLSEMMESPLWEGWKDRFFNLAQQMSPPFQAIIASEMIQWACTGLMEYTARPEPLKNWTAKVTAPSASTHAATLAMGGV